MPTATTMPTVAAGPIRMSDVTAQEAGKVLVLGLPAIMAVRSEL
jgi:hypothetical protein